MASFTQDGSTNWPYMLCWVSIFVFLFRVFPCEIASFIQLVEKELAVDPFEFPLRNQQVGEWVNSWYVAVWFSAKFMATKPPAFPSPSRDFARKGSVPKNYFKNFGLGIYWWFLPGFPGCFFGKKKHSQGQHTRATAYHQLVSAMYLLCAEAQGVILALFSHKRWDSFGWAGSTWRIESQDFFRGLATMVIVSPLTGVDPLPNGLRGL